MAASGVSTSPVATLPSPACERSSTGTVSNVVYIARFPSATEALAPLKKKAKFVVDTSGMSVHDLKRRIGDLISGRSESLGMTITVKSFGHKHGPAIDADVLFDVRFLPNPYFIEELRPFEGLTRDERDRIVSDGDSIWLVTLDDRILRFDR